MERNVALFRAALHSSALNYDNTAHLVTDGIIGELSEGVESRWISGGNGVQWVYIDLGVKTRLDRAVVHWGESWAVTYDIQISDDALNWKNVSTAHGIGNSAVETNLYAAEARYVRFYMYSASGDNYIIREAELFGENELEYQCGALPEEKRDGTQYLTGGSWRLMRASQVSVTGKCLSKPGYDDSEWLPAAVPGTVLASYIKAGAVPDPNFDDRQFQISEAYFTADFWYRSSFEIKKVQMGKRVFLNFDAVNWKADVYFNGHYLPNKDKKRSASIEGAFIRGKFDVTKYARFGQENYLAVYIYKNETPGEVTTQGLAEGPGPNGGALGADNPTLHATVGWDWLPTIRGRGIGIYGDVYISFGGGVGLCDPCIEAKLNITEEASLLTAENLLLRPGVKLYGGGGEQIGLLKQGAEAQWISADEDGDGFTVDFSESITLGSVTILWGSEAGGAAADMESRHPEKFTLERSEDGVNWINFDAYPGGMADTGWFGIRRAGADAGTDVYEGHAVSDSLQGATAYIPIDMSEWGRGLVRMPVFSPQRARYLRFTVKERRRLNGKPVAARVRELRVYEQSPAEVEQSMTRKYRLDASRAELKFKAELVNYEDRPVTVMVGGVIYEGQLTFERSFELLPGEKKQVEICGIAIDNPRLWWPNTYGEQFLYTVDAFVRINEKGSDDFIDEYDVFAALNSPGASVKRFRFGIREFSYPTDGGLLTLYCNGTRIVARGGNWGMDDGLKLDTPRIYDKKVRLHKEANLTMIRNWIGMTNHPAFYEACDKYGILIWDDFWLANPVDGPEPKDFDMFLSNAADKIKRSRHHAALALYCGRNEGDPPPELNKALRELTGKLDGTRIYIPNSAAMPVGSGGGYCLPQPGGEGGIKQYFNDVSSPVLRSERGIPNVPSLESLKKFIAVENLWPISETWALHDWTYHMNGPTNSYMAALKCYLGGDFLIPEDRVQGQKPDLKDPVFIKYKADIYEMIRAVGRIYTLEDFSRAAQMINFENHRGMFEALAVRRSNGLLMWMSQSSWPSLMWQTYDWYLDTNGGYYGVKAANQPVKAVWDPRDDSIVLANATSRAYEKVTTTVTVYDLRGRLVSTEEYRTELLEADAYGVIAAKAYFDKASTDIVFLRLVLKDADGGILGENTYWHNRRVYMDYRALNELPEAEAELRVAPVSELPDGNVKYTLTVKNGSGVPCVQLRIRTLDFKGEDVLPVFYSDNYFTLLPGGTKTVTAELDREQLGGEPPVFALGGWNVKRGG